MLLGWPQGVGEGRFRGFFMHLDLLGPEAASGPQPKVL